MNRVLIEALIRYGYHGVAQELSEKTLAMMVASGEPACDVGHEGERELTVVHNQGRGTVRNGTLKLDLEDGRHLDSHWLTWLED